MEKQLFHIQWDLNPQEGICWRFRDGYITLHHSTEENSHLHVNVDDNGFVIFWSVTLSFGEVKEFVDQSIEGDFVLPSFPNEHLLIVFNEPHQRFFYGKDRLGMFSLITTANHLTVASNGIEGTEQQPGYSFFDAMNYSFFEYPPYQIARQTVDVPLDSILDTIQEVLVESMVDAPILFSGGLDSTLLAAMSALNGFSPIRLINYAAVSDSPDRLSAHESLVDLQNAFPSTVFILEESTSDVDELIPLRGLLEGCVKPKQITEMDLNIAMVLYQGVKAAHSPTVITGLGADELFCGYIRMAKPNEADNEILEHLKRLWERNGGRDSRVAASLGTSLVFPFLTQRCIDMALSIPVEFIIKENLQRGEREKWILRRLAERLGLHKAAVRPKQAMQFGSRIAKVNWRGDTKIPQS